MTFIRPLSCFTQYGQQGHIEVFSYFLFGQLLSILRIMYLLCHLIFKSSVSQGWCTAYWVARKPRNTSTVPISVRFALYQRTPLPPSVNLKYLISKSAHISGRNFRNISRDWPTSKTFSDSQKSVYLNLGWPESTDITKIMLLKILIYKANIWESVKWVKLFFLDANLCFK